MASLGVSKGGSGGGGAGAQDPAGSVLLDTARVAHTAASGQEDGGEVVGHERCVDEHGFPGLEGVESAEEAQE